MFNLMSNFSGSHHFGCLGGNFSVSEYEPFKAFGSKD